ncbi:MAG TPA: hypothetical protein VMW47_10940 [Verrucomicrobiae bacterium]|nr:hypothetical protein [Verrucomicrobiae bacterium]
MPATVADTSVAITESETAEGRRTWHLRLVRQALAALNDLLLEVDQARLADAPLGRG